MYNTRLTIPNTKIEYRHSTEDGWEYTDDGGEHWYFTFRSLGGILEMHPTAIQVGGEPPEDDDREIFGETLDEEIPEDIWEMIAAV